MFRFTPNTSRRTRNVATRGGSDTSKTSIVIRNENDDDGDDEEESMKKITRENNHIYFHAEVDRDNIFELIEHIRKCELENIITALKLNLEEIPIYLHISSFGGSVFDALTAIDVIQSCKVPVYTIIEGATASAGTLMSVVGKKRYMRPNAYMLIHQLSSGFWGKMSEIEDDFQNNKILMDKIMDIYKEHADIPKKQLGEVLKHDLWWDTEKCQKYGLVDEIWKHT
jgi:ATP-dependent Clp endopeptidase proteolytic subunit ClpP